MSSICRSVRRARLAAPAVAAAALVVAFAGAPASAFADGTYTVAVCDPALGNSNHAFGVGIGWQTMTSAQNCTGGVAGSGRGLQVWPVASTPGAKGAGWWYHAPAGTTIVGLSQYGQFSAWDGWVSHWATSEGGGGDANVAAQGCSSTSCNWFAASTTAVAHASEIGFAIWCHASSCPANDGSSYFGPAASANVYKADITVDEPSPPAVSVNGSLWGHAGWISVANGGGSVGYGASDPAGVCGFRAVITTTGGGWEQLDDHSVSPDLSLASWGSPCPGRNWTSWSPNIAALGDGYHDLWVQASNPSGMWTSAGGAPAVLAIDNTPPTISVSAPPASRWYDTAQQVTWGSSDNLSGVHSLSCSDGSHTSSSYTMTVAAQGVRTISCTAVDSAANRSSSASATVHLDFQTPTVSFSGPSRTAWLSGPQTVTVNAAEAQPLSGIQGISCSLDGATATWTAGSQATVSATANGPHTIACRSLTNAQTWGAVATYSLRIDSTPPTLSYHNGPNQGRWYSSAQSIDVSSQGAAGLAAVALISCTLAGHTTTYPGDKAHITVPSPGGSLVCEAHDQAGNRSSSQAWQFLIDTTPPTGYFAPSDPHDPAAVAVQTADSQSGVAGGEIDIQLPAGWRRLATAYDRSTGELTATVPDDGSIPDGTYPLRAIVLDAVANQTAVTGDANGSMRTVSLPLRNVTQLHVGSSSVLTRRCTLERVTLASGKHHASGQHARAKLVKHCTTVVVPRANGPLTLAFGQRASVQGLLQTADGEPIAGAPVTVGAQPPGWPSQPAGSITTDPQGHFTYQIAPGPSRTITFAFPATSALRGAWATTTVQVAGNATITAGSTARAGHALRLSGNVLGGYIPPGGTLIQLQYRIVGYPQGWMPFAVLVRTHSNGVWSTTIPLRRDAAGLTYQFRGVITTQSGWPYTQTTTNLVTRRVLT